MADDDEAIVLCMRVDEPGTPVNGSTIAMCRCDKSVWVAPSTWTRANGARVVPVCDDCITGKEYGDMYQSIIAPDFTPEMLVELDQHRRDHPNEWR